MYPHGNFAAHGYSATYVHVLPYAYANAADSYPDANSSNVNTDAVLRFIRGLRGG
jgi:pyruvate/2-oxoglutarate dehydrogenase complex dihydrolipoamide acyltransferase (E2) component